MEMESPRQEAKPSGSRWWRWTRRVLLTVLLLLAVAVAGVWVYARWADASAAQAWRQELDVARQRGLPLSREQVLAASPAASRPVARYLRAALAMQADVPTEFQSLPLVGQGRTLDGKTVGPETWALIQRYLAGQKEYFGLLEQAHRHDERLSLVEYRFPVAPPFGSLKMAARHWLLASLAAQAGGDSAEAVRCLREAFWIGGTLDGQPGTALFRLPIGWQAVSELEGALSRCRFTPEQLSQLRDAVLAEDRAIDLHATAVSTVAALAESGSDPDVYVAETTGMLVSYAASNEVAAQSFERLEPGLGAAFVREAAMPSRDRIRFGTTCVWCWQWLCPHAWQAVWAKDMKDALAVVDRMAGPTDAVARWAGSGEVGGNPSGRMMWVKLLEYKALLRAAAVAMEVEAYRRKEGAWPADLAALHSPLPVDPFDGQPLKMVHVGGGIAIYSVGPNLVDDGGKDRAAGGDDLVFRLADPA